VALWGSREAEVLGVRPRRLDDTPPEQVAGAAGQAQEAVGHNTGGMGWLMAVQRMEQSQQALGGA